MGISKDRIRKEVHPKRSIYARIEKLCKKISCKSPKNYMEGAIEKQLIKDEKANE